MSYSVRRGSLAACLIEHLSGCRVPRSRNGAGSNDPGACQLPFAGPPRYATVQAAGCLRLLAVAEVLDNAQQFFIGDEAAVVEQFVFVDL